jgi:PAS domain S-box-containing protein
VDGEVQMSGEPPSSDGVVQELHYLRRRVAELERREAAHDLLAEGGDLFRRLVEHSLGLMCVHDLEGNLLFVNAAAALTLGFHPEDGVGWNLRRFLSSSVESEFDAYLDRIRRNGIDSGLMRLSAKNGGERIWLYRNVLFEEPGMPPRVFGHAQDVTDRVRAEQALRESERRFRTLADTAPVLIWMLDAAGRCTFLNRPWTDFTGRALEGQLGTGWTESIHPEDRDGVIHACRAAIAAGTAFRREYRLRRADGEYRWMLASAVPRTDVDPAFSGLVGSSSDISEARWAREALEEARDALTTLVATRTEELRRSHEQLVAEMRHRARIEQDVARARRLESLGVLAGGIAREFNNLLTVIVGRVQLLLDRFPADEAGRHDLDLIRLSAERAARLTQQLLAFGQRQRLEPQIVDLNRLVARLPLSAVAGRRVDVALRLDERLRPVRVDARQLEGALLRLVERACDAMPDGGRLVVATGHANLDEAFVERHPDASPGLYVWVTIRDDGARLDEATRHRLFEPFGAEGSGAAAGGLGLAAVYGIVKQHGGHVAVESEPKRATAFTIYLPASAEAGPPGPSPDREAPAGIPTILLVEEDQEVRLLLRDILRPRGYHVVEARDLEEASSLVERRAQPIDLVLTNLHLTGIGRAALDRIAGHCPGATLLVMSGYTADPTLRIDALGARTAMLAKPFTTTTLLAKVRELLEHPGDLHHDR